MGLMGPIVWFSLSASLLARRHVDGRQCKKYSQIVVPRTDGRFWVDGAPGLFGCRGGMSSTIMLVARVPDLRVRSRAVLGA